MTLLSPVQVHLKKAVVTMTKSVEVQVYDESIHSNVSKPLNTTHFFPFQLHGDGKPKADIDVNEVMKLLPNDIFHAYDYFGHKIQHCITSGEAVNRRLYTTLVTIYRALGKDEKVLANQDFMKLRDILSDIMKETHKTSKLKSFKSNGEIKALTKGLNNYIRDRNIYTHGELSFDPGNSRFLVYSKVDGKDAYYAIDDDTLNSHLEYYNYVLGILNTFGAEFQNLNNQP